MMFQGVPSSRRRRRAKELLVRLGLGDRLEHRPSELSGGQQQRVSIARALSNNPEVILADEPTGNLDSTTGKVIINFLKELHKEGRTVIMITHDDSLARYADRVEKLKDGVIVGK